MPELKTLFHKSDPITSKEAATKMVKSGALSRQEQEVYNEIVLYEERIKNLRPYPQNNGVTAKELSNWSGLNYWVIQRRLSGLCNKSKIERIQIHTNSDGKPIYKTRNGSCAWRLK